MFLYSFSHCSLFPDLYTCTYMTYMTYKLYFRIIAPKFYGSKVGASLVPNSWSFGNETMYTHAYMDRK